MTILGIGVDIVQVPRILALIQRRGPAKLARRILSEEELDRWSISRSSRDTALSTAQFLAVRWSLKEAAYKALYPAYRPTWKDLAYYPLGAIGPDSKPHISFKCQLDLALHCSVSHDGDYVFTTIVVEK